MQQTYKIQYLYRIGNAEYHIVMKHLYVGSEPGLGDVVFPYPDLITVRRIRFHLVFHQLPK